MGPVSTPLHQLWWTLACESRLCTLPNFTLIAVTCNLCRAQTKQTTGESNLTTGHIAARWCRFAPHLLPLTHPSPSPKWHLDWFSSFCTAPSTESLYFTMGHPSSLEIAPSHWGIWTPCNTLFFGPIRTHNLKGISIGSAVFAQLAAECPYTLQWAAPPAS